MEPDAVLPIYSVLICWKCGTGQVMAIHDEDGYWIRCLNRDCNACGYI